jgi:hypothetical protein
MDEEEGKETICHINHRSKSNLRFAPKDDREKQRKIYNQYP